MPYIDYDTSGNIKGGYTTNRCNSEQILIGVVENILKICDENEVHISNISNYNLNKYKIIDGIFTDISNTDEYKNKIKKQNKNTAYKTYQEGLIQLKSEDELNQFLKICGKITQTEYDTRLVVITTDLTALQNTYLTEVADD